MAAATIARMVVVLRDPVRGTVASSIRRRHRHCIDACRRGLGIELQAISAFPVRRRPGQVAKFMRCLLEGRGPLIGVSAIPPPSGPIVTAMLDVTRRRANIAERAP